MIFPDPWCMSSRNRRQQHAYFLHHVSFYFCFGLLVLELAVWGGVLRILMKETWCMLK